MKPIKRCSWCTEDPLYQAYHDEEWGRPLRDDRALFEMLLLEGAQAGLSWITVLRKRAHYRLVFDGFNPEKMARYSPAKVAALMQDSGIIRNRLKIQAFITNAQAYLELSARGTAFSDLIWRYVDGKPIVNSYRTLAEMPASTPLSGTMSKDLKKLGFRFVGSTICYAYMQAVGLVNDHASDCWTRQL